MCEWISVQEELPKLHALSENVRPWTGRVLVYDEKKGLKFASGYKDNDGKMRWWGECGSFDSCHAVTHWMLPAPPSAENQKG